MASKLTIRKKIFLILGILLTLSVGLSYLALDAIVFKSFARLEKREIMTNLDRYLSALKSDIEKLSSNAYDYSAWDDAYFFVQKKDEGFVKNNFNATVFSNFQLSYIMVFDNEKKLVHASTYDAEQAEPRSLKSNYPLVLAIQQHPHLLTHLIPQTGHSGLMQLAEKFFLFTSRPISKTEAFADIAGSMVFLREINDSYIKMLSEKTKIEASIEFLSPSLPAFSAFNKKLEIIDDNDVHALHTLTDLNGQPLINLTLHFPRDLMQEGRKTFSFVFFQSLSIFAVLFFVMFGFLRKNINVPFRRLIQSLEIIGQKKDLSISIPAVNVFEFDTVVNKINEMLSELQRAQIEKKKMELQLIHSSKLASLGTMSAGIAHEINNPLMIAEGLRSMLKDDLEKNGDMNEERDSFLMRLQKSMKRINEIVDGLRTYAREDGQSKSNIDVHKVILDTLQFSTNIYKKSGLTIQHNLQAQNSIILGNSGKLQQVLLNLINNSLDAINEENEKNDSNNKKEPMVIINTSDAENNQFCLSVKDNGPGIPEDILQKIFDPFFTTKGLGKGTGLGLSILQGIVQELQGRIEVITSPTTGTEFKIYFPSLVKEQMTTIEIGEETMGSIKRASLNENNQNKKRILIVDDEQDVREVIRHYLKGLEVEITEAASGEEGLSKIHELQKQGHFFNVVISDIRMPIMSGDEMILEMKKTDYPAKILVITGALTSEYSKQQRKVIREHANGFLKKPFNDETIKTVLQQFEEEHLASIESMRTQKNNAA